MYDLADQTLCAVTNNKQHLCTVWGNSAARHIYLTNRTNT